MFLFAALLGVSNNLVNSNRVTWIGSAEVMPKPEGWPSLTLRQGVAGGVKFAKHEITQHSILVGLSLLLLAAMIRIAYRRHKIVSAGIISWLRIALGLMFLLAAYPKFSDPKAFALLVTQYQMLPAFAVNLFSIMLLDEKV